METYFFFPPIPNITGGMHVILSTASYLNTIGYKSTLVLKEPCPSLEALAPNVPTIEWEHASPTSHDLWVVPEGWPMALPPGLQAESHCIVYVQNWAYLHGSLPTNIMWSQLPVSLLAVSDPVLLFIKETTSLPATVLRPGIDLTVFCRSRKRDYTKPIQSPIRIAWMPRKNKALAKQIQYSIKAKLALTQPSLQIEWVEIHQQSHKEVADALRESHIFLATGFPEGCPLPPLEALSCGCLVVGFGGIGGWDYMRQALPDGYTPWWTLRDVPWEGNGLYAADADVFGVTMALEHAIYLLQSGGHKLNSILANAQKTADGYSLKKHHQTIKSIWDGLLATNTKIFQK